MSSTSPFGSGSSLTDTVLGNAYPVVKGVYDQLGEISYLVQNVAAITEAGRSAVTSAQQAALDSNQTAQDREATELNAAQTLADRDAVESITESFGTVQEAIDATVAQANVAVSNAAIALEQAGIAAAQAGISTSAAADSVAAKVAAEAARDSINTTGKVFIYSEGTAAGITATTDGQQFAVLSVDSTYWTIYRNNSGIALAVGPGNYTTTYIDNLLSSVPLIGGYVEVEVDASDKPIRAVDADGFDYSAQGESELFKLEHRPNYELGGIAYDRAVATLNEWESLEIDASGRPVRGVAQDGSKWEAFGGVLVKASETAGAPRTYTYSVTTGTHDWPSSVDIMIPHTGQSLSIGSTVDASAVITSSAEHAGFALMPKGGVRTTGTFTSYDDLVESSNGSSLKETACAGMADSILRRLNTNLGAKRRLITCAVGYGGQAYYGSTTIANGGLKRGSATYARLIAAIKSAAAVSSAAGKSLVVPAVVVIHGEEDYKLPTPNREYMRALSQWRMSLDTDIRAITGQPDAVRLYLSQPQRAQTTAVGVDLRTTQAMLDAAAIDPGLVVTGPIYWGDDGGDSSHPSARSYRRMGEQIGDVVAHDLFGAYWTPVRVQRAYWTSPTVIRIEYGRAMAIESDDSHVTISTLGAGKGVDFTDGSGSPPTVTGIALALSNTAIDVTLSAAPTGLRPQVFIAARTTTSSSQIGRVNGARSGIREAAAFDTDPSDGAALYHWACHEQIVISKP